MNILIVDCFDTWEHRVDLLHQILTAEGHRVQCLLSDYRHFEKVYRTEPKKDFRFFHAQAYQKNISPGRLLSHIRLSRDIFAYIDKHSRQIDLLWVLAPPNVFIRDAARIRRKHRHIRLIIDLMDLWPETMPVGKMKSLLFPWRMLRDGSLKYADVIVTECGLYRRVLHRVLAGRRVETLYLAREDRGYAPAVNLPGDRIALCYLGSINNIIDIDGIVRVVKICRQKHPVELHIIGDGEKKQEFMERIRSAGAEVIDHGTVYDRAEKQKIFDACHYGLNMMKSHVCVGLTMKSIDYFEFGLPIINNIQGDTRDIVERYGCGVNVDALTPETFADYPAEQRASSRAFFERALTTSAFAEKVARCLMPGTDWKETNGQD